MTRGRGRKANQAENAPAARESGRRPPAANGDPPRDVGGIKTIVLALAIGAAALALFARSWGHEFTSWDDHAYISNNANLRDLAGLKRIWFSTENEQYYPLTFTSFWLEYHLWGPNPTGYHVVNTALHALNAALLMLVLVRVGLSRRAAVIAALAFAVHPMQVMSVAWVAERKNLLSCLCLGLTVLAWLRGRRAGGVGWKIGAAGLFALALLSKSAVAVAPIALVLLDRAVNRSSWRSSTWAAAPLAMLSVAAVAVTRHFEQSFLDPTAYAAIPTVTHRVLHATTAIWVYAGRMLWPVNLAPIYPRWALSPGDPLSWLGLICAVGFGVLAWTARRRWSPAARWGLPWFAAFLLPILGLVAYGNLAVSPVSDHYVYIACAGLFAAVADGLDRRFFETNFSIENLPAKLPSPQPSPWKGEGVNRAAVITIGALLVCGVWVVQTWNYIPVFKSAQSLWTRALARDANCYPAHLGLARVRLDQGKADDAATHYEAAARIHPDRCEGYAGLGAAAIRLEQWDTARAALDRALAVQPRFVPALIDRASVAERDRDVALARTLLSTAVSQEPNHALAQLRLGGVLLRTGATAEALTAFDTVVRLRPDDPSGYQGVAEASKLLGRWDAALSAARAGLSVRPNHLSLKNLLAVILATCPDDRLRNGPEAVRLAEEVAQALGPADFHGLETLAAALAETGQFDAAARQAREAARLARAAGREDAANANERWATQFEARQPRRG